MRFNRTVIGCVALMTMVCGCLMRKAPIDRSSLPRVMFTLDDGFREHYDLVAPILEKFGFRGNFNVIVDRIGSEGYMTWEQLRDLDRRGHAIENHTLSHPNLVELAKAGKRDEVAREIKMAQHAIAREVGRRPTVFCHPYTATNRMIDEIVRDNWMVPMDVRRRNFGEGTVPGTESGAGAYIRKCIGERRWRIDLLTHGVTKEGPAWRPFPSVDVFEKHVQEVRRLYDQGLIDVVLYRDAFR